MTAARTMPVPKLFPNIPTETLLQRFAELYDLLRARGAANQAHQVINAEVDDSLSALSAEALAQRAGALDRSIRHGGLSDGHPPARLSVIPGGLA